MIPLDFVIVLILDEAVTKNGHLVFTIYITYKIELANTKVVYFYNT